MTSLAARIATLSEADRLAVFADMSAEELAAIEYAWRFWARPDQLAPPGDWRTWLILAGRGWGKTKTGAEWVRAEVESGRRRQLAIIGPTADAVRRVQVEGPSGIMATSPPDFRPSYEPSTRRIVWPNGAIAYTFSAEEPDRLRGPNLDGAWGDEITSWASPADVWDMLQMALRLPGPKGDAPQVCVTTTPKPLPILKAILAAPSTVITRGRTLDNAANLDTSTLRYLTEKYGNTTLGRQELEAEILEDMEGAFWNWTMLDECRVTTFPDFKRIVVAVDPSGSNNENSDEVGIIVAALGADGHGYVLGDASGKYTPEGWAQAAVACYRNFSADRIVCERNFGGAMAEATIRSVDPAASIRMVHASRGKAVRAEPVVALYEQRRVHHVGHFPGLEDQLCGWSPLYSKGSPDRLDALVWAFTDLMVTPHTSFAFGSVDINPPRNRSLEGYY